jgi:hypothetical protein
MHANDSVTSVNNRTGAITLTAEDVGLENVTNESKATMFTNPTFTGTVSGVVAGDVDTVTTSFNGKLSAADDTVQKALDTLDDHTHNEADILDLDKYTTTEVDAFLADKANVADLSSTIILYPTTAASDRQLLLSFD